MTEGRSGKSRAMVWVVVVLAMPVLYVLSVPPLYMTDRPDPFAPQPPRFHGKVLADFYMGYFWLSNNTPLRAPLEAYWQWWARILPL
jgi:hypothetical protein